MVDTEVIVASLKRVLATGKRGPTGRVNNIFVNPDHVSRELFPIVFATEHGNVRVAVATEGDNIVFAPEGAEKELVVSQKEILGKPC